jgi:SAM-dependent methyltransferase
MIARRHPPMRAEVLELPEVVDYSRSVAVENGLHDIVDHRAGDALTTDLGIDAYDVVFLGNLIHHFTESQNQGLFRKICQSLRENGTIAIWDFNNRATGRESNTIIDGFALLFRISSSSRLYTPEEISSWLAVAGFVEINICANPHPMHVLITGRKW